MQDIILDLLRTAREPRTVAELVDEIETLIKCKLVKVDAPTPDAVERVLVILCEAGKVRQYGVEWHFVPEVRRQPASVQHTLFV